MIVFLVKTREKMRLTNITENIYLKSCSVLQKSEDRMEKTLGGSSIRLGWAKKCGKTGMSDSTGGSSIRLGWTISRAWSDLIFFSIHI